MEVVLKRHELRLAVPNRSTPDLPAFAHEEVAGPQELRLQLMRRDCHCLDCGQINLVPQNVRRSQEWHFLIPIPSCGGHSLAGADLEEFSETTEGPSTVHDRRASIFASEASISRAFSSRLSISVTMSL